MGNNKTNCSWPGQRQWKGHFPVKLTLGLNDILIMLLIKAKNYVVTPFPWNKCFLLRMLVSIGHIYIYYYLYFSFVYPSVVWLFPDYRCVDSHFWNRWSPVYSKWGTKGDTVFCFICIIRFGYRSVWQKGRFHFASIQLGMTLNIQKSF